MYKIIILIFNILPILLTGQFNSAKYHFEKCKDDNKIDAERCGNAEMSKWIYENIILKVSKSELKDKTLMKLSITIDSQNIVSSCVLSWKDKNRYFIKDIPVKNNRIAGFNTGSVVNVTYTFSETLTTDESLVYMRDVQIFKVVERMPSLDSCLFTLDMNSIDCAKSALISAIKKNIIYSKEAQENKTNGKIPFYIVINIDGYIGEVNVYTKSLGSGAEEALLKALEELKKQKMRFLPGFQRSNPVNVLVGLNYPFDVSKG